MEVFQQASGGKIQHDVMTFCIDVLNDAFHVD